MAIQTQTRISNEAYERLALSAPNAGWELWDGVPREKPGMTAAHNVLQMTLGFILMSQLDPSIFQVRINTGRVQRPGATYFIPDVFVVPTAYVDALFDQHVLEVYEQPLPLVVEIWSRSTGDYDLEEKLAVYQQRGDSEMWFFHPYEREVTAWRRQPDGSYSQSKHREGVSRPAALPGVEVDLAVLLTR